MQSSINILELQRQAVQEYEEAHDNRLVVQAKLKTLLK